MVPVNSHGALRAIPFLIAVCFVALPALANYGGGTGDSDDPYLICTAAQMNAIGATPADWDKHFKLMADIDLSGFDGNEGRPVFKIIAPDSTPTTAGFQGTLFTGVFDGNGYSLSHLTITGEGCLGLFGALGPGARVSGLGVEEISITGSRGPVGGLVGDNGGSILNCYSTGEINIGGSDIDNANVGGLVGSSGYRATIVNCHSTCDVTGLDGSGTSFGGLVGWNQGSVLHCYSTGSVGGYDTDTTGFGGLVGTNAGSVIGCRSAGSVTANGNVGGLAGDNGGRTINCFSTGPVSGNQRVGGLIGYHKGYADNCYSIGKTVGESQSSVGGLMGVSNATAIVSQCFWDTEASEQDQSAAGEGKTTSQMQDIGTFSVAGWDLLGVREDGLHEIWLMPESGSYPSLSIFREYTPVQLTGRGTAEDPYLIHDANELGAILYYDPTADYQLASNIDLTGISWSGAVIPEFSGVFDGGGFVISKLAISTSSRTGLFGTVYPGARVRNVRLEDVNIAGSNYVGGLAGENSGAVQTCDVTGTITGSDYVGGLAGYNSGSILISHNAGSVTGRVSIGGLAGENALGKLISCHNTGPVTGSSSIGGLVGRSEKGSIRACHSTGLVTGTGAGVGGLVGSRDAGIVTASFWDMQTSGQLTSNGGIGRSTEEMQTVGTFREAGWDFVGEKENGLHDIWQMSVAGGYPVLGILNGNKPPRLAGQGTVEEPYLISDANELGAMLYHDPQADYRLMGDINLQGVVWSTIVVVREFSGVFDGHGHTLSGLTIDIRDADDPVGLFGRLESGSRVENLAVWDAYVASTTSSVGILAGSNQGSVVHCNTAGAVAGVSLVGGLVGDNSGGLSDCYSVAEVTAGDYVGGLVGFNTGSVSDSNCTSIVSGGNNVGGLAGQNPGGTIAVCFATGKVTGTQFLGGLVGDNTGRVTECYSDSDVTGGSYVGGLVGDNRSGSVINCYCVGPVHGGSVVGGIAGYNAYGTVLKCYSTGRVSGTEDVGGIVGDNSACYKVVQFPFVYTECDYGQVKDCFWDVQTSGLDTSSGGMGRSTSQMKDLDTYVDAGWNCGSVWEIARNSYPELRWQAAKEPRIPIHDADDLIRLALTPDNWGRHFVLEDDIDLTGIPLEPIGHFAGVFNGQGHTISNLGIQQPDSDYIGLFGRLGGGGTVLNLTLRDVNIQGRSYVGAITGFSIGTIENCHVEGVVSGVGDNVGGIVGYNDESVISCSSAGAVVGDDYVGGIVGFSKANVNDCDSAADVSGKDYVGGLAGLNNKNLNSSRSIGMVGGRDYVGGLVGRNAETGRAENCYSTGHVEGNRHVGGLVGRNNYVIKHCYATGHVGGNNEVGGLIGSSDSVTIVYSFWDMDTSGQPTSAGGTGAKGRTTIDMQAAATFLEAGWDLAEDEIDSGGEDLWWILDGQDYPRLWWEPQPEEAPQEEQPPQS